MASNDVLIVDAQARTELENKPMISESQQEPAKVTTGVPVMQSDTLKKQPLNNLGLRSVASLSHKVLS